MNHTYSSTYSRDSRGNNDRSKRSRDSIIIYIHHIKHASTDSCQPINQSNLTHR